MNNVDTVRGIYAAFGRQDVGWIVERLAEDVEWDYAYAGSTVPWLEPRRGRQGALEFFGALAGLTFSRFEVTHVLGDGPVVVALLDVDATVTATGRTIRERDEVHVWHFDEQRRVRKFRHAADTLQHHRALHG